MNYFTPKKYSGLIKFDVIFVSGVFSILQYYSNYVNMGERGGLSLSISCLVSKLFKTRMTTFIKTKFNISGDQSNIDRYRLAANITEYQN